MAIITVTMDRVVRSILVILIRSLRAVYLIAIMQPVVVRCIFLETRKPLYLHLPIYVILNLPIIQFQMEETTLALRKAVRSALDRSVT